MSIRGFGYQRFLLLGTEQREWVFQLIKNRELLSGHDFDTLDVQSKQLIVDVLIDYYQYLHTKDYIDTKTFQKNRQALLVKRFSLPPGEMDVGFTSSNSPHNGRKVSYTSFGYIDRQSLSGSAIKIRPTYYDSLDFDSGHLKNSSLSMGELDLESVGGRWHVNSLGIVRVENLPRNTTHLPGDRVNSWYVNSGFSKPNDCTRCIVPDFSGGMGYSKSFTKDQVLISILFGGGIFGESIEDDLYVNGRLIGHYNASPSFRLRVEAEYRFDIDDATNKKFYALEARQRLSTHYDLRLKVEDSDELTIKFSSGFYW